MAKPREIWVVPEINGETEEISKLSLGLLSEANYIAAKVGGSVTALVLSDQNQDYSEVFSQYGVTNAYVFQHPALQHFSLEAYSAILVKKIQKDKPWLLLMGHTAVGRELSPRLAVVLETGVISNCVKIDLSDPDRAKFFRPVYGGQLYQELVFRTDKTRLVTMDPASLNIAARQRKGQLKTSVIKPRLSTKATKLKHLKSVPADFRTIDVADADIIASVGIGAATDELLPLVGELAELIGGALGTTRPVVDEGKIPSH